MIIKDNKKQRLMRSRAKTRGTADCPRLTVFRSNKYISAQIIDDSKGVTLAGIAGKSAEEKNSKLTPTQKAKIIGGQIAEIALKKKIKKVVFDRSGYKYHGQIKSLADGAREKGLEF